MPPLWGGMEQLNWHMVDELSKRASVCLVGPVGSRQGIPDGVDVLEVALEPLPWFLLNALAKATKLARRWDPDIVLAGSGLTAPIAEFAARTSRAKSAAYVHGLDVAVDSMLYRKVWIPALRRLDCVVANSRATAQLAKVAGVNSAKIKVVNPGVTISHHRSEDVDRGVNLRAEKKWNDRPLLLSVGRLTNRKGLREFVVNVLPSILEHCPNALLVIVGGAPMNSLHAKAQTVESIQAAAASAGVADHLEFMGVVTDRVRLASIYQAADVHVFPVRDIPNDPEGFGMVAIEAAAHGLPTVAYATGGVVDAVAEGISGHLVPSGDGRAFADAVLALLSRPLPGEGIQDFANHFDWSCFGKKISTALFGMLE
ncbi:glycosyltransferase family 4 protein [Dyella monticola]